MTIFGTPRRHVAQCGSTNDVAREWSRDPDNPASSGALVTADFQSRGRGQRGRQWQAGWGQSALMSFVYHLPPAVEAAQLGLVAALAVMDGLKSAALSPRLKWPNDVLLNGRKVAGVLVEITPPAPMKPDSGGAILGIGINVNQEWFLGAKEFVYPPTSLSMATGKPHEVQRVISAVAQALTKWEGQWRLDGFAPILEECRDRLALGVAVRQGDLTGELVGLAPTGAAQVHLPGGTFEEWGTVD